MTPSPKTCKVGYRLRKAYTRKGKRISSACIRKVGTHNETSAEFKKTTAKRMSMRLKGRHREPVKCEAGNIVRKEYLRITKKGKRVFVPAACINDRGLPGKRTLPGIGPLHKGELTKFGYSVNLLAAERHAALSKAVKEYGSLSTWRKINALYVYTKNTSPAKAAKYNADRNWIRETYGLKAF